MPACGGSGSSPPPPSFPGAWARTYGGAGSDLAAAFGDVISQAGASFSEARLVRLNPDGTIAWQKRYGTADDEGAYAVVPTLDSGFLLAGWEKK